ncbi:MAG: helix-turn-helix domain-containing protein [Deltaproteobacteria bacterium]|nr:helix-turn-helix domain-containing protein [Deltaproteobacteria bacterium]
MSTSESVVAFEPREGLWDATDVGAYVKASRSWVYQKAESGELPCLRLGGLLRFDPEAVRAWVRDREHRATVTPIHQGERG